MIQIKRADLADPKQAEAIVELLNEYANHPMGGSEALTEFTCNNLISSLKLRKECAIFLAYDGDNAIGLCNCFEAFSTFACKPLLNIHDLFVVEAYRKQGIARQMMQQAEQLAKDNGCCKLTLEVLSKNEAAQKSYLASGYKPYQLGDEFGSAEFWQKYL
ncbi:MAG: GNAT family N-acetyltransferase [Gammaproteobacteria bacterium]|jgi:GNAT superfamily N-acetyltransferase|nr:GNAT family N-acetyltransferase [Gammaproteobacteria bacterium]MBT3723356.1 GNAT family N-acetyltransferase [Gammaproteobacteria bacterium]MBT4077603.1 GNAT family N-acetyltransferase [Gammaproteobacteria bacterium]MBT4194192.1 GNAT family N-acetyltransferase [Gammaproteobacteria bacterium]MBT4449377.1 GNAT family N-acetyltransferase [Gammaproteobacteria bacterium]